VLNVFLVLGVMVLAVAAAIVAAVVTLRDSNSACGERRRRIRAQGPFVPLSEEDVAEDEERARLRRRGRVDGEP